ncbi:prolyl-tRNA editing protein proX [Clostridia bacterium]|nr:prolyl-tRNA editing protein proX [Clostridia bacterium]
MRTGDTKETDTAVLYGYCGREGDSKGEVYKVFREYGIPFEAYDHKPLFSEADCDDVQLNPNAKILKNLFLENKDASRYYLYTLPIDKRADLTALRNQIGETRFSFAKEEALWGKLAIKPGSVSLLNIIGSTHENMTFLIDEEVLNYDLIGLHPNDNSATILFSPRQISTLLNRLNAEFRFV